MKKRGLVFTLALCVLGLYGSFLLWLVLQERINTKPYGIAKITGTPIYFKAPLVVNIVQSFFAAIVGLVYSLILTQTNPFGLFTRNDPSTVRILLKFFLVLSITSSIGSPLGYALLKHVDYLGFLLAKLCKLIPVMVVHILLYGTKFAPYKYAVALLVSAGVVLFTVMQTSTKKGDANDGRTILGMAQLLGLMIFDGLTNSTQDHLFQILAKSISNTGQKLTGASLMCILNLMLFVLMVVYTAIFEYLEEFVYAYEFTKLYPSLISNVLIFAILGSLGQVFIFIILEKFDSLILVTATVTRKMISMILSVLLFGHKLNVYQWTGVVMVFGGIGFEGLIKAKGTKIDSVKKKA